MVKSGEARVLLAGLPKTVQKGSLCWEGTCGIPAVMIELDESIFPSLNDRELFAQQHAKSIEDAATRKYHEECAYLVYEYYSRVLKYRLIALTDMDVVFSYSTEISSSPA